MINMNILKSLGLDYVQNFTSTSVQIHKCQLKHFLNPLLVKYIQENYSVLSPLTLGF